MVMFIDIQIEHEIQLFVLAYAFDVLNTKIGRIILPRKYLLKKVFTCNSL